MNARSFALAALTLVAISPAFAEAPKRPAAEPRPAVREQTLLEDLAAGMREIVVAAAPEISLPKLELMLPKLERAAR